MMRGGNPLGNTQAQPASVHGRAMTRITTIKPLKDTRQSFRRNPGAGIGNTQNRSSALSPQSKFNRSACLIVFHRIVREVEQQLAQPMAVAPDRTCPTFPERDRKVFGFGENLGIGKNIPDDLLQRERFGLQDDLAGVGFREQR